MLSTKLTLIALAVAAGLTAALPTSAPACGIAGTLTSGSIPGLPEDTRKTFVPTIAGNGGGMTRLMQDQKRVYCNARYQEFLENGIPRTVPPRRLYTQC